MKKVFVRMIPVLLLGSYLGYVGYQNSKQQQSSFTSIKNADLEMQKEKDVFLPLLGQVKDFSLIAQDEGVFERSQNLDHKVWVASFIFTRCKGPCPMMTQKMHRIQNEIKSQGLDNDVRLVSITMDPDYDSPGVLKEFGLEYGADFKIWSFLTGDKNKIIELAKEAFRVPAGDEPDMHSTRFILMDQQSKIRGYYDVSSEGGVGVHRLLEAVKHLVLKTDYTES